MECTAPYDQPLAITTTNIFKVSHEDAYDSDVDEGPHAAAAFMANLSSTSGTNGATTSHVNEAKIAQPTLYDGHALLKPTNIPVRVHDSEESLVQSEELSREQVYWLHAEELATQKSNPPKPVTPFVHTRLAPSKSMSNAFLRKKKLQIEKKNLLIQNECLITDCIAKDISSIVLTSDRDRPLSKELRSNCVRENSKVIELEAEILKQQQMLAESEKGCSFIQKNNIDLQIKFRNYKECLKNQTIGDNSHSPAVNAVFEINQLKEHLQVKDDTIRKLQTQINSMSMLNVEPTVGSFDKQALETELTQLKDAITSVRIQNDGFKVENVNLKRRYQELSTSNSHSRNTLTRKLIALTAENAKLKSVSLRKIHSEPIVPGKPKVLAPGMYSISSKYIISPRRVNRAELTPLPKKKQATFQEPLKPLNRPTQKTVVQQNKKPNIHVNLSTGVKPATGASKPMSKSDTRNHSTFLAKCEKVRRVEDHHRNLNKQNHVDFRLNVKRTSFVSNSNMVCNACMTYVHSSTGLKTNTMAPMHNGAGPKISALQLGRTRSELVNNPTTPSVPPSTKQLEELFQPLFDDDEEFPPAVQKPSVRVNAAQAPKIATGSPSTSIITESAPATKDHPLENVISDLHHPVSTRQHIETDAMWCFFNEFLTHVEPKNYKQALEHSCWIEAMQDEIHEFKRLDVWVLVPCLDNILIIPLKWIFKIKLDEYGEVLKNKDRKSEHASLLDGCENRLSEWRTMN
nr:hypothetical protein [Tanacetum cinerariifolium]